jgi:hypothetical protein
VSTAELADFAPFLGKCAADSDALFGDFLDVIAQSGHFRLHILHVRLHLRTHQPWLGRHRQDLFDCIRGTNKLFVILIHQRLHVAVERLAFYDSRQR